MSEFKVSVIVTLFNNAEYISECLYSIENQSFKNFEVIVIDDGSSDNPLSLIASFFQRNKDWRYIRQRNHGVGHARNKGVLLARGEYISFVDSDDHIKAGMLEELVKIASKEDACVVLSNFSKVNAVSGNEVAERKDRYDEVGVLGHAERIEYIFGGKIFGMACSSIFKRSLIIKNKIYFPANTYHEDIYVLPRVYAAAGKICHSKMKNYIWRERADSESHSINSRHVLSVLHAILDHQRYLKSIGKYNEIIRNFTTYCIMYLNGLRGRIERTEQSNEIKGYLKDLLRSACALLFKDKSDFLSFHTKSYPEMVAFVEGSEGFKKAIVNSVKVSPIKPISANIAFYPHKLYHTMTMIPIARKMSGLGYSCIFVDMSDAYADEKAYEQFDYGEFPVFKYEELATFQVKYDLSVFMNDWDVKCALPAITRDNALGIPTVGIVEGIQDFWDMDTGRHRNAYQNVKYLVLSGEHDLRHFASKTHKATYIGGVPRLMPLLGDVVEFPDENIALINSNFTYGVLEAERKSWIDAAIVAALDCGYKPVITRHPQDKGDLSGYVVTEDTMYNAISKSTVLISRFSSAIIESVCLGKPVINFNPHIELVDKFSSDLGAFYNCESIEGVKSALIEISRNLRESSPTDYGEKVRERGMDFLRMHCAIGVSGADPEGIAGFFQGILEESSTMPWFENVSPRRCVRPQLDNKLEENYEILKATTMLLSDPKSGIDHVDASIALSSLIKRGEAMRTESRGVALFKKAYLFAKERNFRAHRKAKGLD